MSRPTAQTIIVRALLRYGLSLGTAGALLTGCGGSQSQLNLSPLALGPQQSLAQQAYHIIHPFGRSPKDGQNPSTDLIDVGGTLYGTTVVGGSYGSGTVFSITTSGQEIVLHSFARNARDGGHPMGRLLNVNGVLYGTTVYGGANDGGTVFSMTLDGKNKVLHSFAYLGNGNPRAGLINVGGILYGTTAGLEGYWCGEVFSITASSKFKTLHSFGKGSDGCSPQAPLLNVGGTLYGTTPGGGLHTDGTIFKIIPTGDYQRIYDFGATQSEGQRPMSALINVQGVLYGTTPNGGNESTRGTVFGVTTDGTEKILFSFPASGSDGSGPVAALKNVRGVLYGTTEGGGANDFGTVFKLTKSGKETVVHRFARGDGVNPAAGVIAVDGTLYGTTFGDGAHSLGNVYSLKP